MCVLLGIPTPREARQRISYREFLEWMAFMGIEPQGEGRADLRAGIIASVVAQTHAGKGQRFKPEDFMPKFERASRAPMTADGMRHQLDLAIRAHNRSRR